MVWALLVHLSFNMWGDRETSDVGKFWTYQPYLRFDDDMWRDVMNEMVRAGVNMVVLDLGDGVLYRSHPEIAVKGAWSTDRLREELQRLRDLGIEPIPKMNFSTAHDAWLGEYARCVSTPRYYAVCRDLIAEAVDLFEKPRFFHLGMDEETWEHQRLYAYAVVRQHELWWEDFRFLTTEVEKHGVRPWIWSDYYWHHPDAFVKNMPRSVVQSNWYYGAEIDERDVGGRTYTELEKHGYDQIPTGSNWSSDLNFGRTVRHCAERISTRRLLGFLQTSWMPTIGECRQKLLDAVHQVGEARKSVEEQR